MSQTSPYRYDQVPYVSLPYRRSHPGHLGLMGHLFGLDTAPAASCRVLEIGCAGGGNLLPMAWTLPGSEFVGLDASAVHIQEGHAAIKALGLQNTTLHHSLLQDLDPAAGRFDYIIAHGVYSWIPEDARRALLALVRRHLSPQGVAYVSYNTYPGWHLRDAVRNLMLYHVRSLESPVKKVQQARAILQFMSESVSANDPWGALLAQEAHTMSQKADWYVYHDLLSDYNQPFYFHEFLAQAEAAELRYLAETELHAMLSIQFTPEVRRTLNEITPGIQQLEQFIDFLRGRTFRRTLLCHQERTLSRDVTWDRMTTLFVAAEVKTDERKDGESPDAEAFLVGDNGVRVCAEVPLIQAALKRLGAAWPRQLAFEDLYQAACADLAAQSTALPSRQSLGDHLMTLFSIGAIELMTWQFPVVTDWSERPQVSPVARYLAHDGRARVTTVRHIPLGVDGVDRKLIQLLDGSRSRPAAVQAFLDQFNAEDLKEIRSDQAEGWREDADSLRAAVEARLDLYPGYGLVVG